ncbi:MAG TPA: tol-pal system-associated acyl-CoA thioesterase [Rhodospirillales bacterium]|jgi:acyl-CoA thioester hydrolase|nr:tol-pal system-associated acyl-CoA thioesterase [Rhodospirillales bacterium]
MTEAGSGFVDGVHVFSMRVYYEDTDAAGIVYYANYLKFAERARTEMLRALGTNQSRLSAEDGIAFAVRQCIADFLKPARLDDRLEVHTRVTEVGGASLNADQAVRGEAGELVHLGVRLACTNTSGRPARLPKALRASLQDLTEKN